MQFTNRFAAGSTVRLASMISPANRPLSIESAWSLLSPELVPRVDVARWTQQARSFFAAQIAFVQEFTDPTGELPEFATFEIDVRGVKSNLEPARVRLITLPAADAPGVLAAAEAGVIAIGGAGFDALVARTRRVWQIASQPVAGGSPAAPAVIAAVLAMMLFAPVLPPGGGTIFGIKGTRARLEALGWQT